MNFEHVAGTIVSKGFTERQARFLVLVARHSGVCVMRQYSAFAGVVFGHTTRKFFTKLERVGWVSTYDCARKRARIYHVRHRELYEAIGDAESRLRRPPTVPRALERIMLLDVILRERAAPHVPRRSTDLDAARRHPCPHGRLRDAFRRRGTTRPALAFRRTVPRRPPLVLRDSASRWQPGRCVRR